VIILANAKSRKNDPAKQNENEAVLNRMMLVLVVAISVVSMLIFGHGGRWERMFVSYALPWCQLASAVLFIAAFVYYIYMRRSGTDESNRVITSSFCLVVSAVALSVFLTYNLVGSSYITAAFITAVTLMAFAARYYPVSFFCLTVFTSVGLGFLLAARSGTSNSLFYTILAVAAKVIAVLIPIAGAVWAFVKKKKKGGIRFDSGIRPVFRENESAVPFYVMAALLLAGAATVSFLSGFTVYAVAVISAAYLIIGIIYTIKFKP
jgi:hypothetical protein